MCDDPAAVGRSTSHPGHAAPERRIRKSDRARREASSAAFREIRPLTKFMRMIIIMT